MSNIFLGTTRNYTIMGESEKQAINNKIRDRFNRPKLSEKKT